MEIKDILHACNDLYVPIVLLLTATIIHGYVPDDMLLSFQFLKENQLIVQILLITVELHLAL